MMPVRRTVKALCSSSKMRGESQRVKLTSFDKLMQVTCGIKNVRMCSEPGAKSKLAAKSSGTAPDAAEIQLKSPNWLYGQRKQEEPRKQKLLGASVLPNVKKKSESSDLSRLLALDNFCEMEVFERYLKWTSTEADGWYGSGLLPGSVDDSEANRHYAEFVQCVALDPFSPGPDECGDFIYFCPDKIRDAEDETVIEDMEAASREYEAIAKSSCNVSSGHYEDGGELTQLIIGRSASPPSPFITMKT